MGLLTLTKNYEDLSVLFEADLDGMWDELEAKVNGSIDNDNVATGWGNIGQLTVSDGVALYFGATSTAYISYNGTTDVWTFGNTSSGEHTRFYVNSTEVGYIDGTNHDLVVKKDIYFAHRSTAFSLFRLIGAYRKPVLVYSSSTEIVCENNTETAHQSLICFPSGPVAVTENVGLTHKFRALRTNATANGYISSHTGAADSGLRVGLSLSANTWYFVYAARVRYGDDAGNNFILVLDDTEPTVANHSTLDSRYGSSEWVYLGSVRYGYGENLTTTLVPFQMDHTGWTFFTANGSGSAVVSGAGIQVFSDVTFTSAAYTTLWSIAAGTSGEAIPSIFGIIQLQHIVTEEDGVYYAVSRLVDTLGNMVWQGPSYYTDVDRKDGFCCRIPNVVGLAFQAGWKNSSDSIMYLLISGYQDHFV